MTGTSIAVVRKRPAIRKGVESIEAALYAYNLGVAKSFRGHRQCKSPKFKDQVFIFTTPKCRDVSLHSSVQSPYVIITQNQKSAKEHQLLCLYRDTSRLDDCHLDTSRVRRAHGNMCKALNIQGGTIIDTRRGS